MTVAARAGSEWAACSVRIGWQVNMCWLRRAVDDSSLSSRHPQRRELALHGGQLKLNDGLHAFVAVVSLRHGAGEGCIGDLLHASERADLLRARGGPTLQLVLQGLQLAYG